MLKPSASARWALRKAKRAKIKLVATVLGDSGTSRKTTKTVTLKS